MKRPRIVLGVGERAKQYSLNLPRQRPVVVEDAETGIRFAASFQPENTVLALDEAAEILPVVRELRKAAPETNLVVVSPNLDRDQAEAAVAAGADHCVQSWIAVTGRRLLRVNAARKARRRGPAGSSAPPAAPSSAVH